VAAADGLPGPDGICNYQNRGGSYACLKFGSPHKPIFSYHHVLGDPSKLSPLGLEEGLIIDPSRVVRRRRKSKLANKLKKLATIPDSLVAKKYQDMVIKSLPLSSLSSLSSPIGQHLDKNIQNNFINSDALEDGYFENSASLPQTFTPIPVFFRAPHQTDHDGLSQTNSGESQTDAGLSQTKSSATTRTELLPSTSTIFVTPPPTSMEKDKVELDEDHEMIKQIDQQDQDSSMMTSDENDEKVKTTEQVEKKKEHRLTEADLESLFDYVWKSQDKSRIVIPMSQDVNISKFKPIKKIVDITSTHKHQGGDEVSEEHNP